MLLVTSNLPDKFPEAEHPPREESRNAKRIPSRLGLGATCRVYFPEGLEINVIGISYRFVADCTLMKFLFRGTWLHLDFL